MCSGCAERKQAARLDRDDREWRHLRMQAKGVAFRARPSAREWPRRYGLGRRGDGHAVGELGSSVGKEVVADEVS
jgi:hypothetical protein